MKKYTQVKYVRSRTQPLILGMNKCSLPEHEERKVTCATCIKTFKIGRLLNETAYELTRSSESVLPRLWRNV